MGKSRLSSIVALEDRYNGCLRCSLAQANPLMLS